MALDELKRTTIRKAFTSFKTKWACVENNALLTNKGITAEKLVWIMSKAFALLTKEVGTWWINEVEFASIVHSSMFRVIIICWQQLCTVEV